MPRSRLFVCYDVADSKRLRRMHRLLRGFGDALQYSVFACDLSPKERVLLEMSIVDIINEREDRVMILDGGPAEGRGAEAVRVFGRQEMPETRQAVIV